MAETAAEKIVVDSDVFSEQVRALNASEIEFAKAAQAAGTHLDVQSMGVMNMFLTGAINSLADHTEGLLRDAQSMAERMSLGVARANNLFSETERDATKGFEQLAEGADS